MSYLLILNFYQQSQILGGKKHFAGRTKELCLWLDVTPESLVRDLQSVGAVTE